MGKWACHSTWVTKCPECGHALRPSKKIEATIYGFHVPRVVHTISKRCVWRQCGLTHGPNYYVKNSDKISSTTPYRHRRHGHCLPLFINAKTGFDVEFLDYQLAMMFRSQATALGAAFAMTATWGSGK
eukprot:3528162-Amphidinium_carterae.1